MYIDSIEKIWQQSLVRINFHWPWATAKVDDWYSIRLFLYLKINEQTRYLFDYRSWEQRNH